MTVHRLRYGRRWTGIEIRLLDGHVSFGFRWSRRVFNAPAGPWLAIYRRGILLDAQTLHPRLWRRNA